MLPGLIDAHCHAYGISLDMMATESSSRSVTWRWPPPGGWAGR